MGYLFLVFALMAGVTKGYCGKKTSGYLNGFRDSMMANLIRMGLCILIGFLIVLFGGDWKALLPSGKLLLISAMSGIFTSIFVVTWLVSVKKSAYMMLDVFLMLGVLIPLIAGNLFFREQITLTQWIGIAVLFIAVVIMCSYNNSIKEKLTLSSLLLLIACGAANGIADFSQKLFVKELPEIPASVFNFYTYVFAAVTLLLAYILIKPQAQETEKSNFRKVAVYILIMAICLFGNSFFKTLAANHLDSVLLYPLNQGAALILSSAMSALLFKEKLTAKCIIGLVIAFVGLIIINVL